MQGVHAPAHTYAGVLVAGALAVYANFAAGLRQHRIAGKDGATVAIAAQRLAGEKAGAAECRQVAALLPVLGCAKALRSVFNYGQVAVALGNGVDGCHIGALPVQAHGHDGSGAGRDGGFYQGRVYQPRVWLYIHKHGFATQQRDDFGGGGKGKWGGDDFIACLQTQRHQANQQGFGATGYRNAVCRASALRQCAFKLGYFGAHDVLAVLKHGLHALVDAAF